MAEMSDLILIEGGVRGVESVIVETERLMTRNKRTRWNFS